MVLILVNKTFPKSLHLLIMKGKPWTKSEIKILEESYRNLSHKEINNLLPDRTLKAIKTKLKKLGFVKEMFRWSESEIEFLKANYETKHSQEIADALGFEVRAVWHKATRLGLKKSAEWIAENARQNMERADHPGKKFQFKKGNKSWNKNTKGLTSANRTSFKHGHQPHNHVAVGTESFVDGYWKVKIAEPNIWKWKHRLIWENNNGPIPKGHAIVFRDGNTSNFSIENLELVTRRELRLRNSLHNQYTPELRKTIQQLAGLKRRINTKKEKFNA